MSTINLTLNESENKRALSIFAQIQSPRIFSNLLLTDNLIAHGLSSFFSAPARNFYVRFEKHNLTYTRCAWTGGTTEFPVPPGSNVKTSAQNLTNGEITVFHNFCDFIRIVMYELCFVSHRSHTYRKFTVVSQLT